MNLFGCRECPPAQMMVSWSVVSSGHQVQHSSTESAVTTSPGNKPGTHLPTPGTPLGSASSVTAAYFTRRLSEYCINSLAVLCTTECLPLFPTTLAHLTMSSIIASLTVDLFHAAVCRLCRLLSWLSVSSV